MKRHPPQSRCIEAESGPGTVEDFREGKATVLMALTRERADTRDRAVLDELHGNAGLDDEGAYLFRAIIQRTGAHTAVMELIDDRVRQCRSVVDDASIADPVRHTLAALVGFAAYRNH